MRLVKNDFFLLVIYRGIRITLISSSAGISQSIQRGTMGLLYNVPDVPQAGQMPFFSHTAYTTSFLVPNGGSFFC